jgi:hypothetical protein
VKTKTYTLTGSALDWAVAKCEGATDAWRSDAPFFWDGAHPCIRIGGHDVNYSPSTDWSLGGPIIEREGIEVLCNLSLAQAKAFKQAKPDWFACRKQRRSDHFHGLTPLIAAMRCYVTSKLGTEIDVPEELVDL